MGARRASSVTPGSPGSANPRTSPPPPGLRIVPLGRDLCATYPPPPANPHRDSVGASGWPWSTARATAPSPGRPTPGVVKQDKSSGGSVDTTKTRSGPQRVRLSGGERPIGAAKGTQSDTEALCQPPFVHSLARGPATAAQATLSPGSGGPDGVAQHRNGGPRPSPGARALRTTSASTHAPTRRVSAAPALVRCAVKSRTWPTTTTPSPPPRSSKRDCSVRGLWTCTVISACDSSSRPSVEVDRPSPASPRPPTHTQSPISHVRCGGEGSLGIAVVRSSAGARVGGTSRGRSSTCEGRDDRPTLTPHRGFSPVGWHRQCKQLILERSHRCLLQPTVIVPRAHWDAYGRGSLPLHNLVSDSATPQYVSDPLPRPLWDHRSTGQL